MTARERVDVAELRASGRLPDTYAWRPLFHGFACAGEDVYHVVGGQGDVLARCRGCGHQAVQAQRRRQPKPPPPPVTDVTPAVVVRSRYVCPEHGEPVNARGAGCQSCLREREDGR